MYSPWQGKEFSICHCHQNLSPSLLKVMCLCWSHPHTLVTGDSARPCHLCYDLRMRLSWILTSFTSDNSAVLKSPTSPCCQISMLAFKPCHLCKARLESINGNTVSILDVDGWIWPTFLRGAKKCDCKVMLCISLCLLHNDLVMWSDKLLKHLSNPTFQKSFCFPSQ